MTTKRVCIVTVVVVASAMLSGCFLGFFLGGGDLSVSVGSESVAPRAYELSPMADEDYYKVEIRAENRGGLVGAFTPDEFVLDIDGVWLYGPLWQEYALLDMSTTGTGDVIPNHVNMVHAKDFIRGVNPDANRWNGLMVQFQPEGNGSSNDDLYIRSVVAIDLGPAYTGISLPDEITAELTDVTAGLHYFGFESLQPIETGDGFLSYLVFGDDIEEPSIQNPTGQIAEWELPVGAGSFGNSVQLFFPGPTIVLRGFASPEISLDWDIENLVEVYDAKTPGDKTDDLVTFSVSDPFPLSLSIREWEPIEQPGTGEDVTPPSDVLLPAIAGTNTVNTLQWINPPDRDFSHVRIVRKADSAPASTDDGTVVNEGYRPNYWDSTGQSGTHYFYGVYALDAAGNASPGVILDQVQP